uniref:Uncharacterized protein n=1 Tax=Lepeophtheirus salmonis TaxID=72036 RepID=A0A0K2SWL0_LEPSM
MKNFNHFLQFAYPSYVVLCYPHFFSLLIAFLDFLIFLIFV